MPLSDFMTETASTTRNPPKDVNDMIGDPVTHLESVKVTTRMLPDSRRVEAIRKAVGIEGGVIQMFELYTESHEHTDDSVTVTQVPDIIAGDRVILDGVTYNVRTAEVESPTSSFGQTLIIVITEDRRK